MIVEARPGTNTLRVGTTAQAAPDTALPDLQVIVSRPLGDGSDVVCDADFPTVGGVPGTDPIDFEAEGVARAINDLGCRTDDGMGIAQGRSGRFCTRAAQTGLIAPVTAGTQVQFCLPVAKAWAFPGGDTIVAARVRDMGGQIGPVVEMVIRVAPAP